MAGLTPSGAGWLWLAVCAKEKGLGASAPGCFEKIEEVAPTLLGCAGNGVAAALFVWEGGKNDDVGGTTGAPQPKDGAAVGGFDVGGKRDGVVIDGANAEVDTLVVDSSSLSMKPPILFGGAAGVAVPNIGAFATSWAGAPHIF